MTAASLQRLCARRAAGAGGAALAADAVDRAAGAPDRVAGAGRSLARGGCTQTGGGRGAGGGGVRRMRRFAPALAAIAAVSVPLSGATFGASRSNAANRFGAAP